MYDITRGSDAFAQIGTRHVYVSAAELGIARIGGARVAVVTTNVYVFASAYGVARISCAKVVVVAVERGRVTSSDSSIGAARNIARIIRSASN